MRERPAHDNIILMKLAIVISSNDAETVWNAFRFAVYARKEKDDVSVFLMGKGVEAEQIDAPGFRVTEQIRAFTENGGRTLACGTCLKSRGKEGSEACPLSTMKDLYEMVRAADKVVSF